MRGGSRTVLLKACVASTLVALAIVMVTRLGAMLAPPPEPPLVLHEVRPPPTTVALPSPAANASSSRTAAPLRRARIVGAGQAEVTLRAEPGSRGSRIKGLVDGAVLELLGHEVDMNGRTWRHVRDPTDGSEGWVAGEFLGPGPLR